MTLSAYKQEDGKKRIDIDFNTEDITDRVFSSMLIDRFLEIPVVGFNGDEKKLDGMDMLKTFIDIAKNKDKE